MDKYNNTIHSVIGITPFEALYGKTLTPNNTISNSQQRKMQNELILAKLKNKRIKDRMFQNKNRGTPKVYEPGEEVLLKKNKQIVSKHVNPKKIMTVEKNQQVTILDRNDHKFHKADVSKKIIDQD